MAAFLARDDRRKARLRKARPAVVLGANDLPEVIYVDHFGNIVTGLRAGSLSRDRVLVVEGIRIPHARVFSEVPHGQLFWYENSLGLVEVAANSANARQILGIATGCPIGAEDDAKAPLRVGF